MNGTEISASDKRFLGTCYGLLVITLALMIAGFFSWSLNVDLTRDIKLLIRFAVAGITFLMYKWMVRKGYVSSLRYENSLALLFYIAYLFLGLVSFFWSTNISFSALQWFMDVEGFVYAFFFIRILVTLNEYFPETKIKLYNLLAQASFLVICIFVVGKFVNPDRFYRLTHGGEESRLGGWMMNPNELGMLCAVSISCFLYSMSVNKFSYFSSVKIAVLLYALVLTGSRSSMTGLILIVLFYVFTSKNLVLKLITVVSGSIAIPLIIKFTFVKQGGWSEVLSLTGRLPFWKALLTEGLPKQPLFGFGFMRIANTDTFQSVHTYAGEMTHNTFIQVLMNLGLVGFFIVLLQMTFAIRGLFTQPDKKFRLMIIGIFIPVLINSFTEFGIFGENNYGMLFYQFIILILCMQFNHNLSFKEKLSRTKSSNFSLPGIA